MSPRRCTITSDRRSSSKTVKDRPVYVSQGSKELLLQSRISSGQLHGANYRKLIEELKTGFLTGLPSTTLAPKLNFKQNYSKIVSDREAWESGLSVTAKST